jgi:uncharacterized protein YrrD
MLDDADTARRLLMMNTINHITGSTITASDGQIGHVSSAFFDDQAWAIRYLVVDTGSWLSGRAVLVSPYAVLQPVGTTKNINVSLTRDQVKNSPDIDAHQPVSRQHEREYLDYYAYPEYWDGGAMWSMGALPVLPTERRISDTAKAVHARAERNDDIHLRSSKEVNGYDIQATDDSIGHVKDFIFDEDSWAIRYLVVDTRNWWPGGKKVLVSTQWIDRIDWADKKVYARLSREQVKDSPAYDESTIIHRDYETRLHQVHERTGYWDR